MRYTLMDIVAKTVLATLVCALGAAIVWQLPVARRFKRISLMGLTVTPFAAALMLVFGF